MNWLKIRHQYGVIELDKKRVILSLMKDVDNSNLGELSKGLIKQFLNESFEKENS